MMRKMLIGVMVAAFAFAPAAWATDDQDVAVMLRTLPLLSKKLSGNTSVAIVYDTNIPESRDDAEQIKAILDKSADVQSGIKLAPQLTGMGELSSLPRAQIVFLAHGLSSADLQSAANAVSGSGILTVSADEKCAASNQCVLSVASKPKVQVYYSARAADRNKVSFSPTFVLLVKQVGDE